MCKKFKSEDSIEREKILEKFEAVCAMFVLDLIGVKVFGYSDETAEAVASGEKLLKESQTVYESFADMMSPDDAAKYLDFLEDGSKEGLTSAELAGVEKADALLVSRKVEYEDVWDLRNVGDALEGGSTSKYLEQLDNLSENKINHMIDGSKNSNHGWEKLVPDKNWSDIKNIIADAMDTGVEGPYKSVLSKKATINGFEVEVTYTKLSDGTIKISDAWVNQ